ncbi:carboxypeptidase B-like [Dermacentor albipictus]|uniref:carboxypeptidase B-like n=1 Tax=Dermacentor albipictus TaxID=60249 RepID=UPI0031FD93C8
MARPLLCLVAALLAPTGSWASPTSKRMPRADYTGHRVVSVTAATAADVGLLSSLADTLQLDVWQESAAVGRPALIRLRPEVADDFLATASRKGLNVTTKCLNLQESIDKERREMRFTTYSTTQDHFTRYLRYSEFKDALQNYAKEYDHVTYTSIGKSYEGRDIIGAHIKTKENQPIVFFECGIHAREWISHATCLYIIDQLATQYETDEEVKRLLSKYEWRIYPVVNPDGYEYTHTDDPLWRKTRSVSRLKSECRGADANRNFDVSNFCKVRSSNDPCSDGYCGDGPFSEPEVRAVRDALVSTQGRTEFYFSMHSFSQYWMYPYGYTNVSVPNHELLANISLAATEAIFKLQGTEYEVGPISKVVYRVSGSSVDWAYDHAGVKKAFAIELQPSWRTFDENMAFAMPVRKILPSVKETWVGIKGAVNY